MAKVKKTIGRVPTARFEYADGETYYSGNIVTRYGSAFQCTAGSTTTPPATLDASGKVMLGEGWIFFADATGVEEAKNGVAALERDLGQYAELPSVAMTAETTGKYINADGEFVVDADFNIAAIGAVVVGNTYELFMSSADKMKLGVALFVARIKTMTTSGTERIEYVPLFSAMSTDIPTSGYVCFEAMEAYSDVLICYRADVPEAATLLVRRYGTKASVATQINNMRKKLDLKSFADGYYESMRVGTADNLTSKGDATEEVIMSRKAGGDNQIEDGSASIKRIKGYSVVNNQIIRNHDFAAGEKSWILEKGITITTEDGVAVISKTENERNKGISQAETTIPIGEKFLFRCVVKHECDDNVVKARVGGNYYALNNSGNYLQYAHIGASTHSDATFALFFSIDTSAIMYVKEINVYNLTWMFGSGNEPTTPDDFAKRLGYSSIDDVPYIPYNEGEIVSSFAEGIKTTDTEGKVSERKWSETLKKYFPDGLKSAGSAYDEITPTKAVKRIGMLNLGDIDWGQGGGNKKTSWVPKTFNVKGLIVIPSALNTAANFGCAKYLASGATLAENQGADKIIGVNRGGWIYIYDSAYETATPEQFKQSLQGVMLYYEMATPEETAYDELNLTEQVSEGGTEEAIITDGKTSTPLRAEIVYPIDAYNTIKANKTNIGTLSSLNTASKTDLVSAINELAGKVGALEAKATESVTNETTE